MWSHLFIHPTTLTPLIALGLAVAWTLWRPGALPAALVVACAALLAWAASGVAHTGRVAEPLLAQLLHQLG